jgi:hypothetical protein
MNFDKFVWPCGCSGILFYVGTLIRGTILHECAECADPDEGGIGPIDCGPF